MDKKAQVFRFRQLLLKIGRVHAQQVDRSGHPADPGQGITGAERCVGRMIISNNIIDIIVGESRQAQIPLHIFHLQVIAFIIKILFGKGGDLCVDQKSVDDAVHIFQGEIHAVFHMA